VSDLLIVSLLAFLFFVVIKFTYLAEDRHFRLNFSDKIITMLLLLLLLMMMMMMMTRVSGGRRRLHKLGAKNCNFSTSRCSIRSLMLPLNFFNGGFLVPKFCIFEESFSTSQNYGRHGRAIVFLLCVRTLCNDDGDCNGCNRSYCSHSSRL